MFKRAQAAMEFLMTYGWAILVVLAAIGALAYFGVLSPGNLLPQRCEFTAGLDCTETPSALASVGTIEFPLTNSNGYRIHPVSATVTDSDGLAGCTGSVFESGGIPVTEVANGNNFIVRLTGCTGMIQGDRYTATVNVEFVSNSTGMTHRNVGRLVGKAG